MTQYYLPPTGIQGAVPFDGVVREDGAWIPADPANRDWANYQTWRAEGNDPLDWDHDGPSGPVFKQPGQTAPEAPEVA